MDGARSSKESPANDRFRALVEEQKSIRDQQKTNKSSRTVQQEKYNALDAQIKSMIANQKAARGKMGFKNVEEIDQQIARLREQIDSGKMKLVDEKKALDQIPSLNRQKKGFSAFDDSQKRIDQKKVEAAEVKKTFDNPEARALSQKFEDNQKELDEIKAVRDDTNKNFDAIRAEREKLKDEQKATYAKIREIKDNYHQSRKAYKEYEDHLYQQRRERQKAERGAFEKNKRKEAAAKRLEEASAPAYMDEILTAEGLVRYFDPSSAVSDPSKGPSKFAATAQRTVDEPTGMKVMKKDEEDFFVGGGGKKKGKGKKGAAGGAPSENAKFNMNIGVMEELGKVGVDPPSNQSDVPTVVEKLKAKLDAWKRDQHKQTKAVSTMEFLQSLKLIPTQNIDKAQKDIDRLEKEATEAPSSSPPPKVGGRRRGDASKKVASNDAGVNGGVSGVAELAQEKDAAADATEDLQQTSIEDKEAPADEI